MAQDKPTHTPTPWRPSELMAQGLHMNDGGAVIMGAGGDEGRRVCVVDAANPPRKNAYKHVCAERDANVEFIIRAVNSHGALVKALELWERAEAAVANCTEHDPEDAAETCEHCFPLVDDARLAMRAALAQARGMKEEGAQEP